jgi:hypothetical protein
MKNIPGGVPDICPYCKDNSQRKYEKPAYHEHEAGQKTSFIQDMEYFKVLAFTSAVLVFPHHFESSMSTAPEASSAEPKTLSAMRVRYFLFIIHYRFYFLFCPVLTSGFGGLRRYWAKIGDISIER